MELAFEMLVWSWLMMLLLLSVLQTVSQTVLLASNVTIGNVPLLVSNASIGIISPSETWMLLADSSYDSNSSNRRIG